MKSSFNKSLHVGYLIFFKLSIIMGKIIAQPSSSKGYRFDSRIFNFISNTVSKFHTLYCIFLVWFNLNQIIFYKKLK